MLPTNPQFQLTGGPHTSQQPAFHFIANQQKFYAQITPDKVPLMFGEDRRPGTADKNGVVSSAKRAPRTNTGIAAQLYMGSRTQGQAFYPASMKNATAVPSQQDINTPQHTKLTKIKPGKQTLREKEYLYEEALKLKMDMNKVKDENLKLKTRVRQLESEVMRKEKNIEDIYNAAASSQSHYMSGKSGSNAGSQPQINQNQILGQSQPYGNKQNQESFLVMSLKKQIGDLKRELARKEEESEVNKKNLRLTKVQEMEVEVKAYKDECTRLRSWLDELARQKNPSIRDNDQIVQLQQQIQQRDFALSQMGQEHQRMHQMLMQKEEELKAKEADKDKENKKDGKEMNKLKKSLKEKEKECQKLRTDLMAQKAVPQIPEVAKKVSDGPNKQDEGQQVKTLQNQVAQLRKQVKEQIADIKTKKDKIDESDSVVKKLQERLQAKVDELSQLQKKVGSLEQDQQKYKEQDDKQLKVKELAEQSKDDLLKLQLYAQTKGIQANEFVKQVRSKCHIHLQPKTIELLALVKDEELIQIIGYYRIYSEGESEAMKVKLNKELAKSKQTFEYACSLEDDEQSGHVSLDQFEQVIKDADFKLSDDLVKWMKVYYLDCEKFSVIYQKICQDLNQKLVQIKPKQSKESPSKSLKVKADAEEADYDDDFDDDEEAKRQDERDKKQEDADEEEKQQDYVEEEEMLDVAEHCFIRIAEIMIEKGVSVRNLFSKLASPEQFADGTVIELLSPVGFLEGIKELGLTSLTELEAACLLRVLNKPELENAIILNELVLIMENFGVIENFDDDDDDDYEDDEESKKSESSPKKEVEEEKAAQDNDGEDKPKRKKVSVDMTKFDEKAIKILRKVARFLLERYMHPREFFGPAIYKQVVKTKLKENFVDMIQTKDFYLRLKLAGIRKSIKENESINSTLCLDAKYGSLLYVKKMVKALEEVAKDEQEKMMELEAMSMEGNPDLPGTMMVNENYGAPQFGSLNGGLGIGQASNGGARMYMMGGLGTIEEEKHETQTSNYFGKDGGDETDESHAHKSRILSSAILDDTQSKQVEFDVQKPAPEIEEDYSEEEQTDEKPGVSVKLVEDKSIADMKSVSDGQPVEEEINESPIKGSPDKALASYDESADYEF